MSYGAVTDPLSPSHLDWDIRWSEDLIDTFIVFIYSIQYIGVLIYIMVESFQKYTRIILRFFTTFHARTKLWGIARILLSTDLNKWFSFLSIITYQNIHMYLCSDRPRPNQDPISKNEIVRCRCTFSHWDNPCEN